MFSAIANKDVRWAGFKYKDFDTNKYLAHKDLFYAVQTKFTQLKTQAKQAREKEEKRIAKEIR